MKNYKNEFSKRTEFIRSCLEDSGAKGIVFGNSGGKDSALVGILCKAACDNTLAVMLPCGSKRNYEDDLNDAKILSEAYSIESRIVDLSRTKDIMLRAFENDGVTQLNKAAQSNIAPRLRMTALYAIAASEGRLVAGTGNRSERYMGYFTKWGDGAFDFNPISDLTVTEIYEFLRYLEAPECFISKAPSAGLFNGQTDEAEMGISYSSIDKYITTGEVSRENLKIIERYHNSSEHKRRAARVFKDK